MSSRSKRAGIAKETVAIVEAGSYVNPSGSSVDMRDWIAESIRDTRTYSPENLDALQDSNGKANSARRIETQIRVFNATTFATAKGILHDLPDARVLCLNFASAKNPGGGFLGGSQAQEEALCRASALYTCIHPQQEYYETNRSCGTCLYTDYMIYSPMVPVFRDDEDQLLDEPYRVSIVTAPAVNRGALANSEPERMPQAAEVMRGRIGKLLSIAVAHDYRHLVLGAWGCGVFRNDPTEIAELFREQATDGGRFVGAFDSLHFGVLDFAKDQATFRAFKEVFSRHAV